MLYFKVGNSTQKSSIVYGVPLQWENSNSWLSIWSDKEDDIIERISARSVTHSGQPIFKLQKRIVGKAARIVIRNYVSSKQATVIRTETKSNARFEFQYLTNRVLNENDLVDPETVASALENMQTLPGNRLENLISSNVNRFPEQLLQPVDNRWNLKDFDADIILVHGLGGDSRMTWTDDERFWPMFWLLHEHVGIESVVGRFNIDSVPSNDKIRVLTVDHHADMTHIDQDSNPSNIAQRLIGLLAHAGVGSKPIVWIAHSLGGLIVKELLASQAGTQSDIFNSTKGVVFFGTPHCGATWAAGLRYRNNGYDIPALRYLDPSPSIGERAGNLTRLNELNEFFAKNSIPFVNFSEGAICSIGLPFLPYSFDAIIVPDSQTRIPSNDIVESTEIEIRIGMNALPSRVHYHCPDRHHLNIAKPSDRDHPTYRLTNLYVANWLQRHTATVNDVNRIKWNDFSPQIVHTVRMYAIVVERIDQKQRIQTLVSISTAISLALSRMTINDFLILIAVVSGGLAGGGAAAIAGGTILGGPVGAVVGLIGVAGALALGGLLISRLTPRVKELLTKNSAVIRKMVNLIGTVVVVDFNELESNAQSNQEFNASLNHLRLTIARALCCVFLEPADPMVSLQDPLAIQSAVARHHEVIYKADMVISYLSQAMNGMTMVDSDETEQRAFSPLVEGVVVAQNLAVAAYYYQRAFDHGHIKSGNSLALLYENGSGVTKDLDKAEEIFEKAAERGDSNAMFNLATLLTSRAKFAKAKMWYDRARQEGHIVAQVDTGFEPDLQAKHDILSSFSPHMLSIKEKLFELFSSVKSTTSASTLMAGPSPYDYTMLLEHANRGSKTTRLLCDALEHFIEAFYTFTHNDTLTEVQENMIMHNLSQSYRIEDTVAWYPSVDIRDKLKSLVDRILRRCHNTVSQLDEDTRMCYASLHKDSPKQLINFLSLCKQKYPKSICFFELSAAMKGFLGQYDTTLYEANLGLEIDPNCSQLLYEKAGALRLLEKHVDEAIEAYHAFLSVAFQDHRKVPDSYYAMTMCYLMKANDQGLKNATKMYQKAEEAEKLQSPCFYLMSQALKLPLNFILILCLRSAEN